MLTPRERAAGVYAGAVAQGRGNVIRADMAGVEQERRNNLRNAQAIMAAARGTERRFLREPDDVRLEQMLEHVRSLAKST
jgi:hypothetical protein